MNASFRHRCVRLAVWFSLGGEELGIVGLVVGSSFAVLVAEALFASGCRLLMSLTSAGQIVPSGLSPYFVILIARCETKGPAITVRSRRIRGRCGVGSSG